MSTQMKETVMLTGDGVQFMGDAVDDVMSDMMEEHVKRDDWDDVNKDLKLDPDFRNIDFSQVLRNEWANGYDAGYASAKQDSHKELRKRIKNQRMELRRLNRKLNAIHSGIKMVANSTKERTQ